MPATITPDRCPDCGERPKGTVERVYGIALLAETGEGFQYDGETEIDWDGQESETDPANGNPIFKCHDGHEWSAKVDGEF